MKCFRVGGTGAFSLGSVVAGIFPALFCVFWGFREMGLVCCCMGSVDLLLFLC